MSATEEADRRSRWELALVLLLLGAGALLAASSIFAPVGDSAASMAWGRSVGDGVKPDLDALLTPVGHPLPILTDAVLSLGGADLVYDGAALIAAAGFLLLGYAVFRLTAFLARQPQHPAVPPLAVAGLAAVIVLSREPIAHIAFAELPDVPFAACVILALCLFCERHLTGPGAGRVPWLPLALLAVAGGLRPEAWPLAIALIGWSIWHGARGRELLGATAVALSGPLLWILFSAWAEGALLHAIQPSASSTEEQFRDSGYLEPSSGEVGIRAALTGTASSFLVIPGLVLTAAALDRYLRDRILTPTLVVGLTAAALFAVLALEDLVGYSPFGRYGLTPSLILASVSFSALTSLGSPRAALAVLALFAAFIWAAHPNQLSSLLDEAERQADSRDEQQDLISLIDAPEIQGALDACPLLTVGGVNQQRVLIGRSLIALYSDLDIGEIGVERNPKPSEEASAFVRGAVRPESISRGEWSFLSGCSTGS